MIDEKMINSVKKTLSFLEELNQKNDSELKEIIKQNNLSGTHFERQEMLELIFKHFITGEDLKYYQRYLDYAKARNAEKIGVTLDSLNDLTGEINGIYQARKISIDLKNSAQKRIETLNRVLINAPYIRASIAFSHVENRKDNFIHTRTIDGMGRAKYTDAISDIQRSGFIVRALKASKMKKLKAGLAEHNQTSLPNLDKAYQDYTDEVKKYCEVLRQLFYEFLDNMTIRRGAYMSHRLYAKIGVNLDEEDLGLKEPSPEELANIDKEELYKSFIDFAKLPSLEILPSELFKEKLIEFIIYYDQTIVNRANYKISNANNTVAQLFNKQKSIVSELITSRDNYIGSTSFNEDEEDTFSLVYTGLDNNYKK